MKLKHSSKALLSFVVGSLLIVFSFQNCSKVGFQPTPVATVNATGSVSSASTGNCVFNGQELTENQSVVAYQNSAVPYGSSCVSENRVCTNGVLNGSYAYAKCEIDAAASCLFDGKTVSDGQNVVAYQNSSVPAGKTCASESRKCNNGALTGSYSFSSCTPGAPASCLFNNTTVANGQNIIAYQSSSVASGQSCSPEIRSCNNGVLSGSYAYANCSVNQAASCIFNNQTIANGQYVTAYFTSSVSSGSTCASETRTCNNGALSGSYTFSACQASPSCVATMGQTCQISAAYDSPLYFVTASTVSCAAALSDAQNRLSAFVAKSPGVTVTNCTQRDSSNNPNVCTGLSPNNDYLGYWACDAHVPATYGTFQCDGSCK
ncbi:MAG: hypothetical protein ACXVCY_13655 [Pseudobdellovibrionaceae bacterium]